LSVDAGVTGADLPPDIINSISGISFHSSWRPYFFSQSYW